MMYGVALLMIRYGYALGGNPYSFSLCFLAVSGWDRSFNLKPQLDNCGAAAYISSEF